MHDMISLYLLCTPGTKQKGAMGTQVRKAKLPMGAQRNETAVEIKDDKLREHP